MKTGRVICGNSFFKRSSARTISSTLSMREYLNRNGHPYAYVDLDRGRGCRLALAMITPIHHLRPVAG